MNKLVFLLCSFFIVVITSAQPTTSMCWTIQPAESTKFDTTPSRGLADNYFLWDNGHTIQVKILNGSEALHQLVKAAAAEWEQYANIKFLFVTDGDAHVRINLGDEGQESLTGTQCMMMPADNPTMLIDTSYNRKLPGFDKRMKGILLHEFGHVLGLLHEINHPKANIQWNKEAIYKEYNSTTHCFGDRRGDREAFEKMFKVYHTSYANGTAYDNKSIMHFSIPARLTKNGYATGWNLTLSEGDKAIAALLYPKNEKRSKEVIRLSASLQQLNVKTDTATKAYRFRPVLNITANKTEEVILMVMLFTKDGDAIYEDGMQYTISGTAGVYKKIRLAAGNNSTDANWYDMLLPYNELPVKEKELMGVVRIYYYDNETAEYKFMYGSNPVKLQLPKKDGM